VSRPRCPSSRAAVASIRRSIVLKHRPDGEPRRQNFEVREDAIPQPTAGEVVTRTIWLSIDPYMRGRLREQQTYAQAVNPGEVMTGETVGEVIASAHADFVPLAEERSDLVVPLSLADEPRGARLEGKRLTLKREYDRAHDETDAC